MARGRSKSKINKKYGVCRSHFHGQVRRSRILAAIVHMRLFKRFVASLFQGLFQSFFQFMLSIFLNLFMHNMLFPTLGQNPANRQISQVRHQSFHSILLFYRHRFLLDLIDLIVGCVGSRIDFRTHQNFEFQSVERARHAYYDVV